MLLLVPCFVVSVDVWLPVVALVLLLSDWSPVVVALSMVTDERPRRSRVGLTVDVEPVWLLFELAVDPVMDEVVPDVDPVVDPVEGVLDVAAEGLAAFEDDEVEPAVASGAQSSCTGLAECSFASPVDLFASLPAFGWAFPDLPASRLLHGGRVALADVVLVLVLGLADAVPLPLMPAVPLPFMLALPLPLMLVEPLVEGCEPDLLELVVSANAGAAIMAATASALMNWERIMDFLLD